MCLSNVYRNSNDSENLLARNVADIQIQEGKVIFTDIMGVRRIFDGSLERIDLTENYIIVRD